MSDQLRSQPIGPTRAKINVKGQAVQQLQWKQADERTDRQTDIRTYVTLLPHDAMLTRNLLSSRVRPSKPVLFRNDWTNQAGFCHVGFLPPIPHYLKKFRYLQQFEDTRIVWRYPSTSGTLSQTLDLQNCATASRSRCQQNSSTMELVDDTYTTVDASWLFTSISCGFVVQLVSAVDKILTDNASRGPSAVAELMLRCSLTRSVTRPAFLSRTAFCVHINVAVVNDDDDGVDSNKLVGPRTERSKLTLAAFAAGAASGELLGAYATITELTSGKRQDGRTGRRTDTRPLLSVMVATNVII